MFKRRKTEPENTVSKTMKIRAEIFVCSYKTAWEQYMTEDEKQGLSFERVYEYTTKK